MIAVEPPGDLCGDLFVYRALLVEATLCHVETPAQLQLEPHGWSQRFARIHLRRQARAHRLGTLIGNPLSEPDISEVRNDLLALFISLCSQPIPHSRLVDGGASRIHRGGEEGRIEKVVLQAPLRPYEHVRVANTKRFQFPLAKQITIPHPQNGSGAAYQRAARVLDARPITGYHDLQLASEFGRQNALHSRRVIRALDYE